MSEPCTVYLSRPGAIASCGLNMQEIWSSVVAAASEGIKKTTTYSGKTFFAGRIDESKLPAVKARYDMKIIRMEAAALSQVQNYINIAKDRYGADRISVCVGSCDNGSEFSVAAHRTYFNSGVFPASYEIEMQGADYVASFINETYGLQGQSLAFATACSSSATALCRAAELIRAGLSDAVVAGGVDIASDTVLLGFDSLKSVSPLPANPFSKNRSGITLGDAAAFFVLSRDSLVPDFPQVVLAGYGESSDAHHATAPDPEGDGAASAMQQALQSAKITSTQIDYLNLHGTGTELNDSMEAKAVSKVFADYKVPCSSTKSVTGHTLGAAGALEAAICYETLVRNTGKSELQFPLQNWDGQADLSMPVLCLLDKNNHSVKSAEIKYCMSNSFAFGGANVSLILGREDTTPVIPQELSKDVLAELLPQKGKMFLLDKVLSWDAHSCTLCAECDINKKNIFYNEQLGGVPNWTCFEMMAQAVAALSAINRILNRDPDKVRGGIILSVNSFMSSVPVFKGGSSLYIRVQEDFHADKVWQYKCKVFKDLHCKEEAASAMLTVMEIKLLEGK